MTARIAAAIVALVALAGLVVQFAATLDHTGWQEIGRAHV